MLTIILAPYTRNQLFLVDGIVRRRSEIPNIILALLNPLRMRKRWNWQREASNEQQDPDPVEVTQRELHEPSNNTYVKSC